MIEPKRKNEDGRLDGIHLGQLVEWTGCVLTCLRWTDHICSAAWRFSKELTSQSVIVTVTVIVIQTRVIKINSSRVGQQTVIQTVWIHSTEYGVHSSTNNNECISRGKGVHDRPQMLLIGGNFTTREKRKKNEPIRCVRIRKKKKKQSSYSGCFLFTIDPATAPNTHTQNTKINTSNMNQNFHSPVQVAVC